MNRKVGIVGLGYVGLPVAVAFGQKYQVVGFDIDEHRVETLQQNVDFTGEVPAEELERAKIEYTTNAEKLKMCDFIIVAVPTPISKVKQPELTSLIKASETVGENLPVGAIVVYESTVYPGATEEVCIPLLEEFSGLKAGKDFFVGYSPERINPGDKERTFEKIVKVVSGQDEKTLEIIADVYGSVVEAGVYRAPSIKVAEAAKVIENTQRDLNIALMNELAILFHKMGLNTNAVLAAARTKWNFLPFEPGLVGGHCIPVDPYYLTCKAEELGYHPEIILAGRRINDSMGIYVTQETVKLLIQAGRAVQGAKVLVLGVTFKENVRDVRNTRVVELVREMRSYGIDVWVHDPLADPEQLEQLALRVVEDPFRAEGQYDAVVLAVAHRVFREKGLKAYLRLLRNEGGPGVMVDLKGILAWKAEENPRILYWSL